MTLLSGPMAWQGYVEQDGRHSPFCTVEEALEFSARMRLKATATPTYRAQLVQVRSRCNRGQGNEGNRLSAYIGRRHVEAMEERKERDCHPLPCAGGLADGCMGIPSLYSPGRISRRC